MQHNKKIYSLSKHDFKLFLGSSDKTKLYPCSISCFIWLKITMEIMATFRGRCFSPILNFIE